jgi:hypothetical protein
MCQIAQEEVAKRTNVPTLLTLCNKLNGLQKYDKAQTNREL